MKQQPTTLYMDIQRRVREVFEHPLVQKTPLDRTYTVAKLIFRAKMMSYTKRSEVRLKWLETEAKPDTILFT
jgi:hypothetical protein